MLSFAAGYACKSGCYVGEWECPRERELRGRDQTCLGGPMAARYHGGT